MADVRPQDILRRLRYHTKAAKSRPYQSLYWHCLNAYWTAETLEGLLRPRLLESDRRILLLSALLHDAGKADPCWQERLRGPHALAEEGREPLAALLKGPDLPPPELTDAEVDDILELVTEHHMRKTRSGCDIERIMTLLKLSDRLVSATRITADQIDAIGQLLQPDFVPLALTAEEHPLSYYALSVADERMENEGAHLIVTNPLQSLYLVPRDANAREMKRRVVDFVGDFLLSKAGETELFTALQSRTSRHPVRDIGQLWRDLQTGGGGARRELRAAIDRARGIAERAAGRGKPSDADQAWYPPVKVLYRISSEMGSRVLLGTDVPIAEVSTGRYPTFGEARHAGQLMGASNPEELTERVVDALARNLPKPVTDGFSLDIFSWSDEEVDATTAALRVYEEYKRTQWNSPVPTSWSKKPPRRSTNEYCFSCKVRPPARKAPTSPHFKIDTWTSSISEKGPVRVCELCFLAHAHILRESEPARFLVQFTPAYNQARVDWRSVLAEGLEIRRKWKDYVNAHRVIVPLDGAQSPSEAVAAVFGPVNGGDGQGTIADFLYENGLTAVVSAGPAHPGGTMLSGMGLAVSSADWERNGRLMRLLMATNPRSDSAAVSLWRTIQSPTGWGTPLATRHRAGKFRSRETAVEVRQVVQMMAKETVFDAVRGIPLYTGDRNERFKSMESVLRRMEQAVLRAARTPEKSGAEITELVAQIGKKQLRTRIIKASEDGAWRISDERLRQVDDALRAVADRLWELRGKHVQRSDFINACIMASAYSYRTEKKEDV